MKVSSIFDSISGEVNSYQGAGELSTFIRLHGCNLKCSWCDTKYAQDGPYFDTLSINEIMDRLNYSHVTITGGEPLLQMTEVNILCLAILNERRRNITIETNGSIVPKRIIIEHPTNIRFVVDCKLNSSGMMDMIKFEKVFEKLRVVDTVKFVIENKNDFQVALKIKEDFWSPNILGPKRVYSPVYNIMDPAELVEWVKEAEFEAMVSLQLHKIIWPQAGGRDNER